jgi:ParB family chromosome partitioning protein
MSTINTENTPKPQHERKAMGRGLSSLIGGVAPAPQANRANTLQERHEPLKQNLGISENVAAVEKVPHSALREVEIEKISPNPEQPRRHFNPEKIEELAASLKEQGLLSPIVVKEVAPDAYQIIAGERRWRASQVAGLKKISVIIREKQKTGIENDLAAIVENIQREDLNPLELAQAYGRMVKTYQITQEELAQKLGISRVKLANTLRLLKLPEDVREMLNQSRISEGHARALLALPNETLIRDVAAQAAQFHLSVRDVETRVRNLITAHEHPQSSQAASLHQASAKNQNSENTKAPQLLAVEDELRKIFGTKVSIVGKKSGGIIELYYSGEDSLNRLVHQMRQTQEKNK